jgi:hypothetical protein
MFVMALGVLRVFHVLPTGCSGVFGNCVYTIRKAVRRLKQDHINRISDEI